MNWVVEWGQVALDELAIAWLSADSEMRQLINLACQEVDRRLARDPYGEGESRDDDDRVMFVPPFSVAYRVQPDEMTVSVLHVRFFKPKHKS